MNGHTIYHTAGFFWCSRCGAHTKIRRQNLLKRCTGRPASAIVACIRSRLMRGYDPAGVVFHGDGRRVLRGDPAYAASPLGRAVA